MHVRDLVRALVLAAERAPAAPGGARRYHLSDGIAHRWTAVNNAIAAAVGRRLRVIGLPRGTAIGVAFIDTLAARVRHTKPLLTRDRIAELAALDWSCDTTRAREELGFAPSIPLLEGMRETADWYRSEGWLRSR
jgi:nucleoside-diphosphate-sugar epimerase